MYFNNLTRTQWKYLQHVLQIRQLQLLRRHVNSAAFVRPPGQTQTQQQPVAVARGNSKLQNNKQTKHHYSDQTELRGSLDELDDCTELGMHHQDALMQQLNETHNTTELLDVMSKNAAQLQCAHHVQGLGILWTFYQHAPADAKQELTEQLKQILLSRLQQHIALMNVDELSCCYLYLRKMHVPNSERVVEQLLIRALHVIKTSAQLVPLTALSRLAVAINLERDFFTPLVCRHFMPHIERHIAVCNDEQQVRLLATCLFQLHTLIDDELLQAYKQRVAQMLQSGLLHSGTTKALLKLLHTLNLPAWAQRHTQLIRELLLVLQPCVPAMEASELKSVCRTFLHQQEPAALAPTLKTATEALLRTEDTPDALACAVPFARPQQREAYIAQFRRLLHSEQAWQLPNASSHFFSVLRALKIADVKPCDLYWSTVLEQLHQQTEQQRNLRFLRHCQRYMNFNNNLGGTYRHQGVERKLAHLCMQAIEYDVAGRLPAKFASLAAFVMAYGHTPFAWKKLPNLLLSKIIGMAAQFDIQDCFLLSRGMQIASELRFRYQLPPLLATQMSTIDSVLIACAERHLALAEHQPLHASALSVIVRTLSHRKSLKNTSAYNQALACYKTLQCNDLNSRVVRDMAYNLNASHFLVPELLDSMFGYVAQQHAHVSGDTVEKVLSCAYNLGYTPTEPEALDYAALVLLRDFEHMSGLSLVQACLALCFYKTIPEQLINQVFCVKFIQRIEDEIQICYSKATYPEHVLNLVMQLNRTVCLDLPEANVPWFQQNYVEAQMSKKPFVRSSFNKDVQLLLKDLLKNDNYFRCNHTTPYGYQIDFVIHFDMDKKPMPAPSMETTILDRITKVAILLLKLDSFCENDLSALRGPESLKMKHLEMMGYKVLHINEHDWNSKYMKAPGAKANYLKCLLQIAH